MCVAVRTAKSPAKFNVVAFKKEEKHPIKKKGGLIEWSQLLPLGGQHLIKNARGQLLS